jgi:hypothetical protein
MNGNNVSWVKKWLMPVAMACCVMALVLLAVPLTGVPATVMGGYGGGGGGGSTPVAPVATVARSIGSLNFTAPSVIAMGTGGTVALTFSAADAAGFDPSSLTFGGAPVQSMYFDAAGNLVVIFDKSRMNLRPGDTSAMLSGTLKGGVPFGGAVPVTVTW